MGGKRRHQFGQIGANFLQGVQAGTRLERIVYLSILGSLPDSPNPCLASKGRAERMLLEDRVAATVLRVPMVIGGESAGAHLCAVTLLRLRARGLARRIAGAVLNYGAYDMRMTPSMANWGARNLVLSTPTVDWFVTNLLPRGGRSDPAVSPLLADLAGLVPALFQVGTSDPLLDDTLFMSRRWEAAGNRADLAIYPGGVHAFDMFNLEIARASWARQDRFVTACLAA